MIRRPYRIVWENGATKTSKSSFHRRRRLDPHRLIALRLERSQDLLDMGPVAGFDGDVEFGPFGRLVEKQPVVIDLEDVGAELAEPRGDLPKHAGPVRDRETEG